MLTQLLNGPISTSLYERYRIEIDAFEKWRGGRQSYHPSEIPADVPIVTNDMRSAIEVFETLRDKPEHLFVYVKPDYESARNGNVTTWTGERLGSYVCAGPNYKDNFGGERVNIRVELRNGAGSYAGTFYKSSGDYARLKRCKKQTA